MPLPLPAAAAAANLALGVAKKALAQLSPEARAREAAREFESVYLAQVLNTMNAGLAEDTGFDGGHAEAQWRSIQNEEVAKAITRAGGVGLADAIARELIKAQERAP